MEIKCIVVAKVDDGENYGIAFTKERIEEKHEYVTVSDVICLDCSGPVTLFSVPDKVWNGIGLTKEWICLFCIGRRLNPHVTADELGVTHAELMGLISAIVSDEIYRQRRKFKLKNVNSYCGAKVAKTQVLLAASFCGSSTATANQVMLRAENP